MKSLAFHSDSLGDTEDFLNLNYTRMRIANSTGVPVRADITRTMLGPVSLDDLHLSFDMNYVAQPLGKICLFEVDSGSIEENYADGTDFFQPGELGLLTPPDVPYSGVIHHARYRITMFDPELLTRVAAASPGHDLEPVRLTGHRPVSAVAARQLSGVLEHMRGLAADSVASEAPLIASTAAQYLAATVLHTLPSTAHLEPTASDRNDAHPDTVRRALAYLEAHVRDDISVADIAAASYVTVRALQLAFRRHLDTTPMAYLRRLRLRGAHEQLRDCSPDDGHTVTSIAAAWGFAHPGRFATAYRGAYGRSPHTTLSA
ncbi:helix-turn-helix domain-containing protein [Nocardia sp. CDC186]|uniref:Helix-turn-helix domain-containing protein n=1 Tax=Nocardia implantans TaxID=3108168 RepID=A0ABU6AU18_9NOCA|nr:MULTISPECIES: helix-turn-helix domain-containing protein [unclassified Nocardia]MBF6191259.1 helix-turn-helix domain-containing protein [Nocardia beijingensis]MEA3532903.1 helix-turn-helix domain-containing protein [Nocardia sp. CDC192]MEB3510925.1 helix-turn-helix domain-containing protein [Nocardia sp. CDC186]